MCRRVGVRTAVEVLRRDTKATDRRQHAWQVRLNLHHHGMRWLGLAALAVEIFVQRLPDTIGYLSRRRGFCDPCISAGTIDETRALRRELAWENLDEEKSGYKSYTHQKIIKLNRSGSDTHRWFFLIVRSFRHSLERQFNSVLNTSCGRTPEPFLSKYPASLYLRFILKYRFHA